MAKAGYRAILSIEGTPVAEAQMASFESTLAELDATPIGGDGNKQYLMGLRTSRFEGTLLWVPDQAAYDALYEAHVNRQVVEVELADDAGYGVSAQCWVTSWRIEGATPDGQLMVRATLLVEGAPVREGATS